MASVQLLTETTRSERFYTALLLPHLLMSDDFLRMRRLFEHLGLDATQDSDTPDIEIVAEMNPIRQFRKSIDSDIGTEDDISERKPDLVLRLGNCVLVIEGKFFTYPSVQRIVDQMREQQKTIDSVLDGTQYSECEFHYMALTVNALDFSDISNSGYLHMTWQDLISVLEPEGSTGSSSDVKYVHDTILRAIELAENRNDGQGAIEVHWKRVNSIDELFRRTPDLLNDGYSYVGIDRNVKKLEDMTLEDMETRREYKYSKKQGRNTGNWPQLTDVVARYLTLKQEAFTNLEEVNEG